MNPSLPLMKASGKALASVTSIIQRSVFSGSTFTSHREWLCMLEAKVAIRRRSRPKAVKRASASLS